MSFLALKKVNYHSSSQYHSQASSLSTFLGNICYVSCGMMYNVNHKVGNSSFSDRYNTNDGNAEPSLIPLQVCSLE